MASRSWNRVELIGNLTRDPELRYTPSGAAVCTFGLATNRTYVTEGERKEEVDFHRLVAWNKLAELCNQLLKKGTKVFISGRLQTRTWVGQDGVQRQTTEIVVEDMILLTPKPVSEAPVEDLESVEGVKEEVAPEKSAKETAAPKKSSSAKQEPTTKAPAPAPSGARPAEPEEIKEDEDLPF